MDVKKTDSNGSDLIPGVPAPPPLLSILNPAPGRFKPRARLLSVRPRRSSRLCITNNTEDPTSVPKGVLQKPSISASCVGTTVTGGPSVESDQIDTNVVTRCPQPIQKFMKRFSMRFTPTSQTESQPTELIKRIPNRFSFNSWRRRKSFSQLENTPDRDRSPLKAASMALDEQWAMFRSTDQSSKQDESNIRLQANREDKENGPCHRKRGIDPQQWATKRRSLWNFSVPPIGVTNVVPSEPLSSALSMSTCQPQREQNTVTFPYCCDPDKTPKPPPSTPYPCKRKSMKNSRPSVTVSQQRRW